jgi:gamma-glutamyltranspeptidase/glutathione hydrolase
VRASDLAAYRAIVRAPIHGTYRGFDIYGPPPPSSGGICVVQMLNVLETFNLRERGRWSPETLHLMIETMRRAFHDRARCLGDTDFVDAPAFLTTKEYAKELASQIDPSKATRSVTVAPDLLPAEESGQTTHFSVIDAGGMVVSNTTTLEQSYGGRIMVKGMGFLLNNEMGDFNPVPGVTDRHGQVGTPANQVAPGKRMLSSMTPVIVARDGKPVMITGSPGGRTIINTVLCVLVNRLEFEMTPRECVEAPRLSLTWLPDVVTVERGLVRDHAASIDALKAMEHIFHDKPKAQGEAHTLIIEPDGTIVGVADQRRGGFAAGY